MSFLKIVYRVFLEEFSVIHENGLWVKLRAYNQTYLYQKLNGYGDNNARKMWSSCGSTNLISYLKTPKSAFVLKFCCLIFSGSIVNTELFSPSPNKVVWLQFDGLVFGVNLNTLILQCFILDQGCCLLGYDAVCSGEKVSDNGFAVRRPSWKCK